MRRATIRDRHRPERPLPLAVAVRCIFTASYGSLGSVTRRPPAVDLSRLDEATKDLDPPFAAVDLDALNANADGMVARSSRHPIRLASKSIRCRSLLHTTGQRPGFAGVMAYSLAEAIWLAEHGVEDVLVAYPSVDRAAWHRLSSDPLLAATISVIVDSIEHLDVIEDVRQQPTSSCASASTSIARCWSDLLTSESGDRHCIHPPTREPWRRPSVTVEGCGWSG